MKLKKNTAKTVCKCSEQKEQIKSVCKVAEIPRSSFYYILKHSDDKNNKDNELMAQIKTLDEEDQKRGSRVKAKQNINGNILNREFNPKHFGQVYVTDISYFKVSEGWLFSIANVSP